ncbi:CshA/CshB family fibrillar adhesin-related protein [Methyloprofundus sp.]|uniref:CshA/CshB family fibrillar adhesin-related protein n=1 Tax=Methyloprofundus sp. TaxID=2020875 RepID=UPI003D0EA4AB
MRLQQILYSIFAKNSNHPLSLNGLTTLMRPQGTKVTRLYKQGVSKQPIGLSLYLREGFNLSIKNKSMKNATSFGVLLSTLFLFFFIPNVYAGYADGTGIGKHQNQIFWLDWQGFSFSNGQSKVFNLPGGVVVTATLSGVSGGGLSAVVPKDIRGFTQGYPNTGHTAIQSCFGCDNKFTMSFTASVGGLSIPVDLVTADAEAANTNEFMKLGTNGDAWRLLEQVEAVNLRVSWTNSDKTIELFGNGHTPFGTVLAVSTNSPA